MESKILNLCRQIKSQHPIDHDSALLICKLINEKKFKTMLEIGTGLGYSSYFFSHNSCIEKITTIEKKMGNYLFAKYFVKDSKINYIWSDCLNYYDNNLFDVIFIDGPKSKYQEIFDKFSNYLNSNGVIVIDNIFLIRLKEKAILYSTNKYKKMIDKVDKFVDKLKKQENWKINCINVGDGLAICERKF